MNLELEFKDNPELLEPWLTVIGMLTVLWSPVERYIDQCVSLLAKCENGKNKPLTLNRKLSFIQKHASSFGYSETEFEDLIKITKSSAQIRDICVHGVIESYDLKELIIGKVQGKASEYTIEIFTITHDRLRFSEKNLMQLNKTWGVLVTVINSHLKNG